MNNGNVKLPHLICVSQINHPAQRAGEITIDRNLKKMISLLTIILNEYMTLILDFRM